MDENERKFPRDLFSGIDGILLVRIWYHVNIIIFVLRNEKTILSVCNTKLRKECNLLEMSVG